MKLFFDERGLVRTKMEIDIKIGIVSNQKKSIFKHIN